MNVDGLLVRVSQTYHFLMADETLSAIDIMKETLAQIAQVVQGCAQFITNYSSRFQNDRPESTNSHTCAFL